METWLITFVVCKDYYDWHENVCIIVAYDKEEAMDKFNKWIVSILSEEHKVMDCEIRIKEIYPDDSGILYQNASPFY